MSSTIHADWDVPGVTAFCTLRTGGVSTEPWASWNLGDHVGDDSQAVAYNRERLRDVLASRGVCQAPVWLEQVHGTRVLELCGQQGPQVTSTFDRTADGAWTQYPGVPCVVMTADCLPVIFSASDGSVVGVAHAGWRGLAGGVLEAVVSSMPVNPEQLSVWLGPAIGPTAFEVGVEVLNAFSEVLGEAALACFTEGAAPGKYLADLYALARLRLAIAGVGTVYGGEHCTYSEPSKFFSYRRDGVTGRMATVVMIDP